MRTLLAGLCFLAIITVQAKGDMTVKDYKANSVSDAGAMTIKLYIVGLGDGMEWANTFTKQAGRPLLYCQPEKLALDANNYIDILERQIKKAADQLTQTELEKTWVGMLLIKGLQETFPCDAKN